MDPVEQYILKCHNEMSFDDFKNRFQGSAYNGGFLINGTMCNVTGEHILFGIRLGINPLDDYRLVLNQFVWYPKYIPRLINEYKIPVNEFVDLFERLCQVNNNDMNSETFEAIKFLAKSGIQFSDMSWLCKIYASAPLHVVKFLIEKMEFDPHINEDIALENALINYDVTILEYLLDRGLEFRKMPNIEDGIPSDHIHLLCQRKCIDVQDLLFNHIKAAIHQGDYHKSICAILEYCNDDLIVSTIHRVIKE